MSEASNAIAPDEIKTTDFHLADLLKWCRENGHAMAIWRSPARTVSGVIDTGNTVITDIELESSQPGFLFHPFSDNHPIHFIKAEIRFEYVNRNIHFSNRVPDKVYNDFKEIHALGGQKSEFRMNPVIPDTEPDRKAFIWLVEAAKKAINEGKFQKVVPSRKMEFHLNGLDIDLLFSRLCESYPNAFVSATFIPDAGIWIGASPEILVHTRDNEIFETVSLAGTQPFDKGKSLQDIAWRQKEIEEQAYVSRYIINCFKKIRLREFDEIGPKTIIAGNLIHLKTTFRVNMTAVNFPQLGSVMMKLLHPTSAVCGMPLESASEWLRNNEGYDRAYFSGFLGPVNFNNETFLYVNLRCMRIVDSTAWIFAGAGVTEDSMSDKEWLETSYKMNTLLDIIG